MATFIKELFFSSSPTEKDFTTLSSQYSQYCPSDLSRRPKYKVTFMGVYNDNQGGVPTFTGAGSRPNEIKEEIELMVGEMKVNSIKVGYVGLQHGTQIFKSMGEVVDASSPFYAKQGKVGNLASGDKHVNGANFILGNGVDIIRVIGGRNQNAVYKVEVIEEYCRKLKEDIKDKLLTLYKSGEVDLTTIGSESSTEETIDEIHAKLLNRKQQQMYTDNRTTFLKLTFYILSIINVILVCLLIYYLSK